MAPASRRDEKRGVEVFSLCSAATFATCVVASVLFKLPAVRQASSAPSCLPRLLSASKWVCNISDPALHTSDGLFMPTSIDREAAPRICSPISTDGSVLKHAIEQKLGTPGLQRNCHHLDLCARARQSPTDPLPHLEIARSFFFDLDGRVMDACAPCDWTCPHLKDVHLSAAHVRIASQLAAAMPCETGNDDANEAACAARSHAYRTLNETLAVLDGVPLVRAQPSALAMLRLAENSDYNCSHGLPVL